jgi:hypothetical protein
MSCLRRSFSLRWDALSEPDWVARYSGSIAAATAAAAAPPVLEGRFNGAFQHMLGSGVLPEQMACLGLESVAAVGFGREQVGPFIVGLDMVGTILKYALVPYQAEHQMHGSERSRREPYAQDSLQYTLSLGRQLLKASGVAEAELDGDGSQAAAVDRAEGFGSLVGPNGVMLDIPDDAEQQLRLVWDHYSNCLFFAVMVFKGAMFVCSGEGVQVTTGCWMRQLVPVTLLWIFLSRGEQRDAACVI